MGKVQKGVLALFIPTIILIATYGIMSNITPNHNLRLTETWPGWVISLGLIAGFEFWLFGTKKQEQSTDLNTDK